MLSRRTASPPQQGQRTANRLRLGVSATLELSSGPRRCLIDDISATGAHLRAHGLLPKGATAVLHFHELHLYATLVWSRDGECGLRFEKQLPAEDMQGMLWITQHRELYERLCSDSRALDWSQGIGD